MFQPPRRYGIITGVLISLAAVAVSMAALSALETRINSTTVALVEIFVIVLIARLFEWRAALIASVVASVAFNYFFLPPYYTLHIAEPQNWASFVVFLAVAATVGHLSSMSNRRREEAERLLQELGSAFERASEAEGLKRSEKLKSALLDAVTHDFRTPLTSIKASVTMLIENAQFKTSDLDRNARDELLEVINEETDRLNSFVESMVEAARFQSGAEVLTRTAASVEEIVLKAARRSRRSKQTHRLRSMIEPDLPAVQVDPRSIVEVLFNLIDNAAKYAPSGTEITIAAAREDNFVRLSVEDEGPGIPDAEREPVFQRFYRAGPSKGNDHGLGMGLAIVRGIIEAHGGRIWIEQGAKGARFVFDLPVISNGN